MNVKRELGKVIKVNIMRNLGLDAELRSIIFSICSIFKQFKPKRLHQLLNQWLTSLCRVLHLWMLAISLLLVGHQLARQKSLLSLWPDQRSRQCWDERRKKLQYIRFEKPPYAVEIAVMPLIVKPYWSGILLHNFRSSMGACGSLPWFHRSLCPRCWLWTRELSSPFEDQNNMSIES